MPIKAIWNNTTIAHTDEYKIVEGRYYFPPHSVSEDHMQKNGNKYVSRWKGTANYYDVIVGNKIVRDAALAYHEPEKEAEEIRGYFSFGDDIEIVKIKDEDGE